MASDGFRRAPVARAKAMNYLEVHMIGRDELLDIAILYPRTYRKLRRQIALLALRRGIIRRAKALLGFDESTLLAGRHDVFPSREATKTKKKAFLIENVLQVSASAERPVDCPLGAPTVDRPLARLPATRWSATTATSTRAHAFACAAGGHDQVGGGARGRRVPLKRLRGQRRRAAAAAVAV